MAFLVAAENLACQIKSDFRSGQVRSGQVKVRSSPVGRGGGSVKSCHVGVIQSDGLALLFERNDKN